MTPATKQPRSPRRPRWVGLAAAGALALSACSGEAADDADADDEASSASPSAPTSSATTDEVEITAPGTQLSFGESAAVDYQVRKQGTLLRLTVKSATQGALKDFAGFNLADPYQKKANYYYVKVKVKNVGDKRLGGVEVPLWGISGDNTLLPPVRFTSSFKKCPTENLPKKFGPGKSHNTCLVFLSPNKGTLEGVSYRPVESFDPIEWRGKVKTQGTKAKSKKNKKGKKKSGNG